jgi:hypothetical protein
MASPHPASKTPPSPTTSRIFDLSLPRPSLRTILLGSGVVSLVWYVATDALASWWDKEYSYTDQTFSELLAAGAPTRTLMVALNGIPYGLLVAAFAAGIWASASGTRRRRITGAMLAGYAATGTLTGVFLQMDRREVIASGEATLRNTFHGPGTMVMSLFLLVAMVAAATLLGRKFKYYTYATVVTLVVFGVLTSLQIGQMEANEPTPWMGLKERVNIYATMVWISVLAIGLLSADPSRTVELLRGERDRVERQSGRTLL